MTTGRRCTAICPQGHDMAGQQCGDYEGHAGEHTAVVASCFASGSVSPRTAPEPTMDWQCEGCLRWWPIGHNCLRCLKPVASDPCDVCGEQTSTSGICHNKQCSQKGYPIGYLRGLRGNVALAGVSPRTATPEPTLGIPDLRELEWECGCAEEHQRPFGPPTFKISEKGNEVVVRCGNCTCVLASMRNAFDSPLSPEPPRTATDPTPAENGAPRSPTTCSCGHHRRVHREHSNGAFWYECEAAGCSCGAFKGGPRIDMHHYGCNLSKPRPEPGVGCTCAVRYPERHPPELQIGSRGSATAEPTTPEPIAWAVLDENGEMFGRPFHSKEGAEGMRSTADECFIQNAPYHVAPLFLHPPVAPTAPRDLFLDALNAVGITSDTINGVTRWWVEGEPGPKSFDTPRLALEALISLRPVGSPEAPTPPTESQESAQAYVAATWEALLVVLSGVERDTRNDILGAVHVQNSARRQLELANIFALRDRAESLAAEKASLSSRVAQLEAQLAEQDTMLAATVGLQRSVAEQYTALQSRVAAMQATPADIALLRTTAQEYEDSAHACDSPALRPMRRVRNLKAIGLRDLADKLSARSSLTEKPPEGT